MIWQFLLWLIELRTSLVSVRMLVQSLASLSRLKIWLCHKLWCGVGHRLGLDVVLLWLWPAAAAPIRSLAWELHVQQVRPLKKKDYLAQLPFFFFFLFFSFFGPPGDIWRFPGWGSNWSYSFQPALQQLGIWAKSATFTTAHSNAGSLTHWVRPGIEPKTSWFLVGFVSSKPWRELAAPYIWGYWPRRWSNSKIQISGLRAGEPGRSLGSALSLFFCFCGLFPSLWQLKDFDVQLLTLSKCFQLEFASSHSA